MFVADTASSKQLAPCLASAHRCWWWPFGRGLHQQQPLASFPLGSAITAANLQRDPSLGGG